MTDKEKTYIAELRKKGLGYKKISQKTGISADTVKTYCRRNGMSCQRNDLDSTKCMACGQPIVQNPGRKEKKFCSDRCRNQWWNSRLDLVNRKAMYHFTCSFCSKDFIAYGNAQRKYCSHACYIADRFGGGDHEQQ